MQKSTSSSTSEYYEFSKDVIVNEHKNYRNSSNRNVHTITNSSNNNNDLVGNLEEFGLSSYESRAYLTMIGKGSLSASEIAYYSNLPRTKIYLTLKKLEKKGLSVISQQKPLICSAINPKEAFETIVSIQEQRYKTMKKVIDRLQRLNDDCSYIKGLQEKRYFILDPKSTFEQLSKLIENSRNSVTAMLDVWGLRLIIECLPSIIKALTKGIKIRILLSDRCIGQENLCVLPDDVTVKIGNINSNIIIIDSGNVINIDGGNGKAALFTSVDVLGFSYMKTFEEEWGKAIAIINLPNVEPNIQLKSIKLTKFVEDMSRTLNSPHLYFQQTYGESAVLTPASEFLSKDLSKHNTLNEKDDIVDNQHHPSTTQFEKVPTGNLANISLILNLIEKYEINFKTLAIDEFFKIIDLALQMNYSGGLKYDQNNNILTIYSRTKSKSLVTWAILIISYFTTLNYYLDVIPKISEISNSSTVDSFYIKFSKISIG